MARDCEFDWWLIYAQSSKEGKELATISRRGIRKARLESSCSFSCVFGANSQNVNFACQMARER